MPTSSPRGWNLLLAGLLLVPAGLPAQADPPSPDTIDEAGAEWVALPFLLYTPETGLGGGGAVGHYRRLGQAPEPSSFLTALTVTLRKQLSVEFLPDVYLSGGSRVDGGIRFRHYPDVFYGIGQGTPEELEEEYTSRVVDVEVRGRRPVGGGVRLGLEARFRHERMWKVEEDGLLEAGMAPGHDGGTTVGLGVTAARDTRDNLFAPRRGSYVEGSWTVHDRRLGSDFDFHRLLLDARRFLPVGQASVVGLHLYLEAAPGRTPFQLLPLLGGDNRLRGYREGRFRDRGYVAVQGEYRFPVWRRWSGVAFVGAGDVFRNPSDLGLSDLEAAAGIGARFRLTDEGVTLRGDFALGREGTGVYFTLGHAF